MSKTSQSESAEGRSNAKEGFTHNYGYIKWDLQHDVKGTLNYVLNGSELDLYSDISLRCDKNVYS